MGISAERLVIPILDRILVVDDEPLVRNLLAEYLSGEGYLCEVAASGREALQKLGEVPFSLVIADIRMPEVNGLQLLDRITSGYPDVAAIMITAVIDLETAIHTMKQGAFDYITKPFNLDQVVESVRRALRLRQERLDSRKVAQNLEHLVKNKAVALNSALEDLHDQHKVTLEVLVKALDARGHETQCHSQRVQAYTLRLARQFNFTDSQMVDLSRGALLHDIGKIGVPDSILLKPGKLTLEEWDEIKKHPTIGYNILKDVRFLDRVAWMVLCHHERFDGSGYPHSLKGDQIPLEARIFSVLDAFDAMTSDRPYRPAMPSEAARAVLVTHAGTQFDDQVVREFLGVPQADWHRIAEQYSE
jgi:putative nucleotidyltransferase with HDIG domain